MPQIQEGNSDLLSALAYRLPKNIRSEHEVDLFIRSRYDFKTGNIFKLGEKFYPSIGVTPEKVFPYVIEVQPYSNSYLKWVPLSDIFKNIENLRDGHLIITAFRLVHALGLWKEYAI